MTGAPFVWARVARLTAESPAERAAVRLIKVEMVGVGAIVIGRQDGREQVAGAVASFAQEGGVRCVSLPPSKHRDAPPVGEAEAEDVDRIGGGMLAERPFRLTVEPPTAVAARMVDPDHAAAEMTAIAATFSFHGRRSFS